MRRTSSSSNPQSTQKHRRQSYNIIMNSIQTIKEIPSLIRRRELALYAWTQVDIFSIRTPEECQTLRRSYCSTGRAVFNPHATYPKWSGFVSSLSVSVTLYISKHLQCCYNSKSNQKSGYVPERSSFRVGHINWMLGPVGKASS